MILHKAEVKEETMAAKKKSAPKKKKGSAPPKAAKVEKRDAGERGEVREAIFALFDAKGVEATDEQVQAVASKHGKTDLSHNNCIKYRSVWRKARGVAAERGSPKPKKAKAAAAPKAAKAGPFKKAERKPKAKAPKKAKAAKQKGNGAVEAKAGSGPVDALLEALDGA